MNTKLLKKLKRKYIIINDWFGNYYLIDKKPIEEFLMFFGYNKNINEKEKQQYETTGFVWYV